MEIPPDAEIASEKLTHYLLVPRPLDDKSKSLARGGFHRANPQALHDAIRALAVGESIATVTVPESSIEPLAADEILSVRRLKAS